MPSGMLWGKVGRANVTVEEHNTKMRLYRTTKLHPEHRGAVIMIGNFDGVHLGHHALIEAVRAYATEHECPLGVLTFEPHPRLFFAQKPEPFLLTPKQQRSDLFQGLGFDFVVMQPFDADFTELKALHFIERILLADMGVSAVVVGEDFGFGQHREGNVDALQHRSEFDTIVVHEVFDNDLGVAYSSTKIRALLGTGETRLANTMMGHAFTVTGTVFRNEQTGRELGFPTANVRPMLNQIRPKLGVYAGRVRLNDGRVFDAAINWGLRPSVADRGLMYEAYLFDFDEDLYSQTIRIALLDYIRPEVTFAGIDALKEQIAQDCRQVAHILAEIPADSSVGCPITPEIRKLPLMSASQRTAIEAATFRRLVQHFQQHTEVQNIDLMLLADFCRNCLSKWYEAAAAEQDVTLDKATARAIIYGEPYADWKAKYQTEATAEKIAALAARQKQKDQT